MPTCDADLSIALPVRPSALPAARRQVRAFLAAHVESRELGDILLCLHEAMKNAVRHSGSQHAIDVAVRLAERCVELVVRDHGVGLPPHLTPGHGALAAPESLADSGRGLYLISQLMDEFEIELAGGTTVRMVKRLP